MSRHVLVLLIGGASVLGALVALADGTPAQPQLEHPLVARYGGVVRLPKAAEQPRGGTKIVLDITVDSKPSEVNRGLESAARYLNLGASAGLQPGDSKLALVLHGGATKAALSDAAYAKLTGAEHNPNRELLRVLREHGVELFVCGQSLARNNYPLAGVSPEVGIAASALTVNANRQRDGYSYIAIP